MVRHSAQPFLLSNEDVDRPFSVTAGCRGYCERRSPWGPVLWRQSPQKPLRHLFFLRSEQAASDDDCHAKHRSHDSGRQTEPVHDPEMNSAAYCFLGYFLRPNVYILKGSRFILLKMIYTKESLFLIKREVYVVP